MLCMCWENRTRQAERYCVECQDYYCIPCIDMHKTFPSMRGHKLLDSTHSLRSSLPCFPTERCPIHKAKLLDMFCKNHDEVVCATCVAISHRTCQDLHSIPDEVDDLYKVSAAEQTKKQLVAAKKVVEGIKKTKQQLLSELKKQKQEATDSIIKYRKELEAELKRMETKSLNEVDAQLSSIERNLQSEIKKAEQQIEDLEQSASKLQTSSGNKSQEFVCVKVAMKDIKVKSSTYSIQSPAEVELRFSADKRIKDYLKQIKELGKLYKAKTSKKQKTTAYKVKQQTNINIKLTENKLTCSIVGSCFTDDGSLLLADFNNDKLKRLNVSTDTIIDHLDLEAEPRAVCLTSKTEAAVSLRNIIQFVSLGDKMTTTRKLKMDHSCYGLAFKDGKLFISDSFMTVYIHDIYGTVLHKVQTEQSGKQIFEKIKHLCVSKNKDCVYVADSKKGFITLDLQGKYLSTFNDPDLVGLRGVCTDKTGNILICWYGLSNIVQISEDSNTKLGIIKTEQKPLSVCFDPQQNKLAVTHEANNTIKVYELE